MEDFSREIAIIFKNPWVVKFTIAFVGLLIIRGLMFLLRRSFAKYVVDSPTSYRVRKLVTIFGYFVVILFLAIVFKDRLGGLTVAIGVAGAGVAFALQEVIASVAGWAAIIFANFYSTGDRVQLGGIRGDVIDIGVLRTTLMELGEWVKGDQYTGRIVRIANSFVFKEPVFNYSSDFPVYLGRIDRTHHPHQRLCPGPGDPAKYPGRSSRSVRQPRQKILEERGQTLPGGRRHDRPEGVALL